MLKVHAQLETGDLIDISNMSLGSILMLEIVELYYI